jgi:hypothetical protein
MWFVITEATSAAVAAVAALAGRQTAGTPETGGN